MREAIVKQFKHPSGVLGRLAGWIMAHRESNLRRNAWVVSLLDIEPHHTVLELGCGPGIALGHAANLATKGRVVGVDHSELMVHAAAKRNASAVAAGRVEVIHGTAETAADLNERFDRMFAVNVAQFWDAPDKTLRALRAVITPGGMIGIAFQPRNKGASDEDARRGAERNQQLLVDAGFGDVRVETLDLDPMVTCVLGRV
jgi:SAM-dependent methyltransferase